MYKRVNKSGEINPVFSVEVERFLEFAFTNEQSILPSGTYEGVALFIRCPCKKCQLLKYKSRDAVHLDLLRKGFMLSYTRWYAHGEIEPSVQQAQQAIVDDDYNEFDGVQQMVMDQNIPGTSSTWEEQEPNLHARRFYEMLEAGDQPLWEGCQRFSKLQASSRFLNWKADCNVPETTYNRNIAMVKEMLPDSEQLVGSFYETKKMLKQLNLPKEKIHACKKHCMLFYKEYADYDTCQVCGEPRYKTSGQNNKVPQLVLMYLSVTERLQRMYLCKKTAKEMTWHRQHQTQSGKMVHPSDGEAWKHFDRLHPDFAQEIGNVRLGLCTDGFNPNNSNSNPYSLWPVFLTNYNLPPWMCIKESYVHLALLILDKKSPGQNLDVFLRPLIDELKTLFLEGVHTYDAFRKTNFTMRAVLLWTVSDFPAYAMLSSWSTHGKLACLYCMGNACAFQLRSGGKSCWFDCHRKFLPQRHAFRHDRKQFRKGHTEKADPPLVPTGQQIWNQVCSLPTVYDGVPHGSRHYRKPVGFGVTHNWVKRSIFWELPYWHTLLIRHNLDVMHIEKNVFDNLFHTIMDTLKSKDNIKARKNIEEYCNRPELHIREERNKTFKPKASYTLNKEQVGKVGGWLKTLKFPDGYASNIGSLVNLEDGSFYGFKSHDCHVFVQRLLPIAIKGMVPTQIWDAITELCTFFRAICSKVLHKEDLIQLKTSIVETICKLERVFPPGFFDSMEHLVVHLADEALVGGLVQYRWMYLYERRLGSLKSTVRNRAMIEGSIVEAYLVNELSNYCALYFEPTVETRLNREPRNFAPECESSDQRLSIFKTPCRPLYDKARRHCQLDDGDMHKAHTYILLNCQEVFPFITTFNDWIRCSEPNIDEVGLDKRRGDLFAGWFENYVSIHMNFYSSSFICT